MDHGVDKNLVAKQLLFELKNHIKYISSEDLQFILKNALSFSLQDNNGYDHNVRLKNQVIVEIRINFADEIHLEIEKHTSDQFWYKKDKLHRIDKPAIKFVIIDAIKGEIIAENWVNGNFISYVLA